MIQWDARSQEERGLLNPSFCANLLWHAAGGYVDGRSDLMSFEEAFLVLPVVLHRSTRESLPRSTRTSLAVWLEENPLSRGRIANRAQVLVPFTKEALLFAGLHGFISCNAGKLQAVETWQTTVSRSLRQSSDEVRLCAKRAIFVGKWFAQTGSPTTVLALLGVRP